MDYDDSLCDYLYDDGRSSMINHYCVYFIESHRKRQFVKLYLAKEYLGISDLKVAYKINLKKYPNFEISIYSFNLYPERLTDKFQKLSKIEAVIVIEDEKGNKFEKSIHNMKVFENEFLFDFKFEEKSFKLLKKNTQPPESLNLSHVEQFKIYIKYIKNFLSLGRENDFLVSRIQTFLNDEKYDFCNYLYVFLECETEQFIKKQLLLFEPEKLNGIGDLEEEDLLNISVKLSNLESCPEQLFFNIEEKDKNKRQEIIDNYKLKLCSLIFYFNYCFYKERLPILLDNKSINKSIYQGLYRYRNLYTSVELSKDNIQELINTYSTFEELSWTLTFNTNFLILLQLIADNLKKFSEAFKKECKNMKNDEQKKLIDIGLLAKAKKEDDLESIYVLLNFILDFVMVDYHFSFLEFNQILFKNYISFYEGNNLERLRDILRLINLIKKHNNNYKIDKNIKRSIYKTGIDLILSGKMSNMEILNYIKNDINYSLQLQIDSRSFDIFERININLIDREFLEEWKKMKLYEKYKTNQSDFAIKVCNIIKSIKDLNILFKLLYLEENISNKDIVCNYIIFIQNRYAILFPKTYSKENCPNFIDDSATLINYSEKYEADAELFLKNHLMKILPTNLIYEIFYKYIKTYDNIKEQVQKIIAMFMTTYTEDQNMDILLLFKKCNCYQSLISPIFNRYLIQYNEIFLLEESNNVKLLKEILKSDLFENKNFIDYNNYNKFLMQAIKSKIEEKEILYDDINKFFMNENNKKILNERLLIIFLMDKNDAEAKMNLITQEFQKVNEEIKNLELVIDDKKYFFKNTNGVDKDIEQIQNIIKTIKNSALNYCEKNKNIIDEYLSDIISIKEREIKKASILFREIYKKEKENKALDDSTCLNNSEEKLDKIIKYLVNRNEKIDKDLTNIFLLLKFDSDSIDSEVNILKSLYHEEQEDDIININSKMADSLTFIYCKVKLLKLIYSMINIIEFTQAKKTTFFNLLHALEANVEKCSDISVITFTSKILRNYSVDIYEEEDDYIRILIILSECPECIKYLFNITYNDYEKAKQTLTNKTRINILKEIYKFIENLRNKNPFPSMQDKELIKKIKQEANKNKQILLSISNFISLFKDIEYSLKLN